MRVRTETNDVIIYYINNGVSVLQEDNVNTSERTDNIFAGMIRIAAKKSGVVKYFHADHLGSTRVVTDEAGAWTAKYKYDVFGKTIAYIGSDNAGYKFSGKHEDTDTGFYCFGARFYDPEIGKFITLDSMKDGLNWYEYCKGNPLRYIDPSGGIGIESVNVIQTTVYISGVRCIDTYDEKNNWDDSQEKGFLDKALEKTLDWLEKKVPGGSTARGIFKEMTKNPQTEKIVNRLENETPFFLREVHETIIFIYEAACDSKGQIMRPTPCIVERTVYYIDFANGETYEISKEEYDALSKITEGDVTYADYPNAYGSYFDDGYDDVYYN